MTQVYVGATNVGSMTLDHEPELVTSLNSQDNKRFEYKSYSQDVNIQKGAQVGMFKLGSTVVSVFEAPKNLEWKVKQGESIRYGETFAEVPGTSDLVKQAGSEKRGDSKSGSFFGIFG